MMNLDDFDRLDPLFRDKLEEMTAEQEQTRAERVEAKANELLADDDWVHDTMVRFNLFKDVSSYCLGDDDIMWKVKRMICGHAKSQAEKSI